MTKGRMIDAIARAGAKKEKAVLARENAFRKLSSARKRVAVAKDALDMIRVKLLRPTNGLWFILTNAHGVPLADNYELKNRFANRRSDGDRDLRQELFSSGASGASEATACEACALGALFASVVHIDNKMPLSELTSDAEAEFKTVRNRLLPYFSMVQLELIELAFEQIEYHCRRFFHPSGMSTPDLDPGQDPDPDPDLARRRALNFCDPSMTVERRMVKILENIIENKGTFVP